MAASYSCLVTVNAPTRWIADAAQQQLFRFAPRQCVLTTSWGLQPGTALLDWASLEEQPAIYPLADLRIDVAGHTFYGVCTSAVPRVSHDGSTLVSEFQDMRHWLQQDRIYAAFNMGETRLVNGGYRRYYWHILPGDFDRYARTWTSSPYTARQILDFCFAARTVESPWYRLYHDALNLPVHDVDCLGGKPLGSLIQEVSAAVGLTFTLQGGKWTLLWCLKGVGSSPEFPAISTNRRRGLTLSGNPTRVRILGDRNVYQVLNIPMERDWLPAWERYYDFTWFIEDVYQLESLEAAVGGIPAETRYNAIAGDTEHLQGMQLARARALTMTVGQFADLCDTHVGGSGAQWRDTRRFGGRSRLLMPVAVYLREVLFRAFKLPADFGLLNCWGGWQPAATLELREKMLVEVTHSAADGTMGWLGQDIPAGNGYAIALGYQVGQDAFGSLRPEYFDFTKWQQRQLVWQHLPFHVEPDDDAACGFIVFDEPIVRTDDWFTVPTIGGELQGYAVPKAVGTFTVPAVRAALTFAADRFSYVAGRGGRDGGENVPGLGGEFVEESAGAWPFELPYADGLRAYDKAYDLAATLLNRQWYYEVGGYTNQGSLATQLTAMLDRLTVRWGSGGTTEDVDFSAERSRQVSARGVVQLEPERQFERRTSLEHLLPGEAELRSAARKARLEAAAWRKASPGLVRELVDQFRRILGISSPLVPVRVASGSGTLAAGTPLFRAPTAKWPVLPAAAGALTTPVFEGVTVLDADAAGGQVRLTRTGAEGIVLCRVKAGATALAAGDAAGWASGMDGLALAGENVTLPVGSVLEAVPANTTKLVRVRVLGGASPGGGLPVWR